MNQWRAQVSHLTGSRRVVAIDLRGHGRSDPPSDGLYTPEAMSEDVSAVTTALGMPRFVLAGHSYGGSVAIAVAGMHPGEVGGLFLVDANGDLRSLANDQLDALITKLRSPEYEPIISAQWDRVLQGATPDTRRAVLEDLKHTPKAAVVSAFEAMRTFDPLSHLEDYSGPRFAVTTSFNDGNTALHRHVLLDHRLVVDTSHWPHMDKPSALNGLLDEFLGRVDRREARATPPAN
jgi:pimeloyl-ACP methyl ester carboxylesterase